MDGSDNQTLEVRAGAAAWLARLRSEKHTARDEAAFREWLAKDPAHAAAFDIMNAVWEAARAPERDLRGRLPAAQPQVSRRAVFGGVAAATGLGGALLFAEMAQAEVYQTDIGEQKRVRLKDGSEIFLDTDTKVVVTLGAKDRRRATLEYGCANFRLAADSSRLFCVRVADNYVLANQSTFDVRRDGGTSFILSLNGKLQVDSSLPGSGPARILNGGDRLITTETKSTQDKPNLLPLLAWHTGQAIFQDKTLAQVAYEMNRYSTLRIEIADPRIRDLRVSGVYRVGDNLIFAQALATLLPVTFRTFQDRIEISADNKKFREI